VWAAVGAEFGKQAGMERARLGQAGLALLDAGDDWVPSGGWGEGWTVMGCSDGGVWLGSTIDIPTHWKVKVRWRPALEVCRVFRRHHARVAAMQPLNEVPLLHPGVRPLW
jgi:hypothetical protein